VSTLVVNANTSAVTILLPAISRDTGTSTDTLQWAVTGYSLVGAAVIITSGVLGDVFGRRRVFLGGLLLFVASCVLIALSTSGAGVIAGRMIQGAAGSTILACGMSLLSVANSGEAQLRAVTIWGAASAVGAAAGPLVGGLLVDVTGWQGLFWIDAAIALACIPLTLRTVAESRDPDRPPVIDWTGTALVAIALAPLILAFSKGSSWGWLSVPTIVCLLVSIGAVVGFVLVERRAKIPLVDLDLFRNRILVGATIAILIGSGAINGLMYVLSLYFQNPAALGMSALQAGLATLPAAAGLIATATLTAKLASKIGAGKVIFIGFVAMVVGFAALAFVTPSWDYAVFVLPLIGIAIGMGFTNGPASSASTACVPEAQTGSASGISNMARYVGAAIVTAAVAALYAGGLNTQGAGTSAAEAVAHGLSRSSILLAAISATGIGLVAIGRRGRGRQPRALDYATHAASTSHTIVVDGRAAPGPVVQGGAAAGAAAS
jgi:EmrB/QacA subfamily drug resistance transporter